MDTLVRLNADELNQNLIDFIKLSFKGKRIAVHIYEDETDETDYLLSDPVHQEKLLNTVAQINEQKPTQVYTMNELKAMFLSEPEA
ncbi:MAG: hypothetical protein M3Y85_00310 [Bacteroidota bacterium]|nr:hypothetical protein [Bacteroidota bacterium]